VIRVIVRVEGTSEPIPAAQLTLTGGPIPTPAAPPSSTSNAPTTITGPRGGGGVLTGILVSATATTSRNAVTDDNGLAVFDNLPAGRYTISARRDGYIGVRPASLLATALAPTGASASVILDPARLVQETTVFLARGASISGRVHDAYGVPLPNASISI